MHESNLLEGKQEERVVVHQLGEGCLVGWGTSKNDPFMKRKFCGLEKLLRRAKQRAQTEQVLKFEERDERNKSKGTEVTQAEQERNREQRDGLQGKRRGKRGKESYFQDNKK